ncbi:hypothetical protein M9Y10_026018 [Tritrichomonas musculus]|uniref:Plasmodium RESA N-terminal domain-containing protein n=1 Tax=Tritrichomonas musculus TaxID=1915356 RepID=A0ABR2HAL6_9EUKA
MGKTKRGEYQNHMLGCDCIKNKEKLATKDEEKNKVFIYIRIDSDYLDKHGIKKLQDFAGLLKLYGIRRSNIQKFIELLIEIYKLLNSNEPTFKMDKRALRKASLTDLNVRMNRFGHQYPTQFYNAFVTYIIENWYIFKYPEKTMQTLFKNFKSMINVLINTKEEITHNSDDNNNQDQSASNAHENNTTLNRNENDNDNTVNHNENDTILKDHENNTEVNYNENNAKLDCKENDTEPDDNEIYTILSDFENNIEQDDDQNISFLDENENNNLCGFFNSESNYNNCCFSNENDEFGATLVDNEINTESNNNNYCFSYENDGFEYDNFDNTTF